MIKSQIFGFSEKANILTFLKKVHSRATDKFNENILVVDMEQCYSFIMYSQVTKN